MNLEVIFKAIEQIGILNVLLVLFVWQQFRTISWLKKQNELLLKKLLKEPLQLLREEDSGKFAKNLQKICKKKLTA